MQALRTLAARAANMTGRRTYKTPSYYRQPTLNDLPIPQGDFWELEAARNKKYNAILAVGVILCGTALTLASQTDLINLNATPPKSID